MSYDCGEPHAWYRRGELFGPNGPRDQHFHRCINRHCLRKLVGEGADCDPASPHWLQNDRQRDPVGLG